MADDTSTEGTGGRIPHSPCIIETEGVIGTKLECDDFSYQLRLTQGNWYVSTVSMRIIGNPPDILEISDTGLITGHINPYTDQTYFRDILGEPPPMPFSGGLQNIGGYQGSSFTWTFQVEWTVIEQEPEPITDGDSSDSGSGSSSSGSIPSLPPIRRDPYEATYTSPQLQIVEITNNDIKNKLFIKRYLESERTKVGDLPGHEYFEHTVSINGVHYKGKDSVGTVLQLHPGPFSRCRIHG